MSLNNVFLIFSTERPAGLFPPPHEVKGLCVCVCEDERLCRVFRHFFFFY